MIPVIPKEKQVPILETEVLDALGSLYPDAPGAIEQLVHRLHAGAAKYGTAWCEVNLTEDLREEILDAMNYTAMLLVRRSRVLGPKGSADDVMIGMVGELLTSAYKIVSELRQCEGPTSKDWVIERNDSNAQARFQETLARFQGEGQV